MRIRLRKLLCVILRAKCIARNDLIRLIDPPKAKRRHPFGCRRSVSCQNFGYSSLMVNAAGSGSASGANGSNVVSPVSMTGSVIGNASDSTSTS